MYQIQLKINPVKRHKNLTKIRRVMEQENVQPSAISDAIWESRNPVNCVMAFQDLAEQPWFEETVEDARLVRITDIENLMPARKEPSDEANYLL